MAATISALTLTNGLHAKQAAEVVISALVAVENSQPEVARLLLDVAAAILQAGQVQGFHSRSKCWQLSWTRQLLLMSAPVSRRTSTPRHHACYAKAVAVILPNNVSCRSSWCSRQ